MRPRTSQIKSNAGTGGSGERSACIRSAPTQEEQTHQCLLHSCTAQEGAAPLSSLPLSADLPTTGPTVSQPPLSLSMLPLHPPSYPSSMDPNLPRPLGYGSFTSPVQQSSDL